MARNGTQVHKGNEAKYKILALLEPHRRFYSPAEIAEVLGMTQGSVRTRLSKFYKDGYIWRRKEYRANRNRKGFCYRYLKDMGYRVLHGTSGGKHGGFMGMHKRMEIREVIGDSDGKVVSLKVKDNIPHEILDKYNRLRASKS